MDNGLNQLEISSLLKAAHLTGQTTASPDRSVEPWKFERSGQLGAEQASIIKGVHEAMAKGLSQSVSAYLRVGFETALGTVEPATFRDFVEHIAPGTYLLSLQFHGAAAVVQIDKTLVFPLIDVLLGGTGQEQPLEREVTEIEAHILEGVGKIICHEIAMAWGLDSSDCDPAGAIGISQLRSLLHANDTVAAAQFESKMGEAVGHVAVAVPMSTFSTLLRKAANESSQVKAPKASASRHTLGDKLMECTFPATLGIAVIHLPIDRILELALDKVCDLGIPVGQPASLMIAGRDSFQAVPVRQGKKRAAQIGQPKIDSEQKRTGR